MNCDDVEKKFGITNAHLKEAENAKTIEVLQHNIIIEESNVHGLGVFTYSNIQRNKFICYSVKNLIRTSYGRYLNHSDLPNAKFSIIGTDVIILSNQLIGHGSEILVDYERILERIQEPIS